MPDFFQPTTIEGSKLRKEALLMSTHVPAETYLHNMQSMENLEQSADAIAFQLTCKDENLRIHASNEVAKAIHLYAGMKTHEDPSGTYGQALVRISAHYDLDLGDILATNADPDAILALFNNKSFNDF